MKKLLLLISAILTSGIIKSQNCTELFISEYVEGTGNNKAFEIYNPTASSVDLSNYRLVRYSNGSATGTDSTNLVGTLAPLDVFVIVNGQTTGTTTSPACSPDLQALADQLDGVYPVPTYANGDDAICLVKISPYKIVDIFGKIGEDPGTAWDNIFPFNTGTGAWITANHTLQRKGSVKSGVTINPSEFDALSQYDSLPNNTWTGLGTHTCECGTIPPPPPPPTEDCTELFFSEYAEGSGNNKAFEIYNPTASSVDLSNYRLVRYSNGSATGTDSTNLVGTLAPLDVFVIVNGQTTGTTSSPACSPNLQALADQLDGAYPVPTYANGDDAICLIRISPYKIIDILGKIGEDPGTAWDNIFPFNTGTGAWLTANHTLQRKYAIKTGISVNPSEFNALAQYDSLPNNTWTGLGTHACECGTIGLKNSELSSEIKVYPNPSSGNDLSIKTKGVSNSINIINALGEIIYSRSTLYLNELVQLKNINLPNGIYFIEIINNAENSKTIKKVIVQQ
jgi:hypothetical protein